MLFDLSTSTGESHDSTSISPGQIEWLYEDRKGQIWIAIMGPADGLNRYDPVRDAFVRYRHDPEDPSSLIDNRVHAVYEDSRGTLWIGTWGDGLHTYDRERDAFTRFTYDPDDPSRPSLPRIRRGPEVNDPPGPGVTVVYEDRDGRLWIGSHLHGLDRYDPTTGTLAHYEHDPGDPASLDDNRIFRMGESHDGTLWVGTFGGLFKINPSAGRFRSYRHDPNDPSTVAPYWVSALHVDRSGDLWVGTNRGGLQKLDRDSGTFTSFPVEYPGGMTADYFVRHIYEDRSGKLWIGLFGSLGSLGSLWTLDRRSGRVVSAGLAITSTISKIHEDDEDVLWIGTPEGLYRYDRRADTLAPFRHEQQNLRAFDTIYAIGEAQNGALWLGTAGGLFQFDRETHTFTTVLEDLPVTALQEAPSGRLWLATASQGLLLYDPENGVSTSYTMADGLVDNAIGEMLEDDQGFLWLSTERGLSRFDTVHRTFRSYDVSAGLPTDNFLPTNNFPASAAKGRSGELYFGGTGGFVTVFPELMDSSPPRVAMTSLKYTDRSRRAGPQAETGLPISLAETMRLSHAQNDLTFAYVGLHFMNSAGNRYAYRLEGYEDAWRSVGAQRMARYTNLHPGAYTFRVKAANADGVWSAEEASIDFVILPPWWQRGWFYAVCVLGLFALTYAGYQMRVRQLKTRARMLQEEVEARTQELVAEKQKTEAQARRLAELDEIKSRFFANISHEFRTPLTLLVSPLDEALEGRYGTLPAAMQRQVRHMRRNARRLLRLVNQLLDLSKLEAGKLELHPAPGDLPGFLRELVRTFTPLAERREITLQFKPETRTQPLVFDRDALEKVFANLLSNALKFTPEGGKVWVTVTVKREAAVIEVVVKDTGPGIAPSELERIFDRFEQVDGSATRAHEGTGLGLALARELVQLHGGTLRAEGEPGFGSAFIVRLPLQGLPRSAGMPAEAPEPEIPAGDGTVALERTALAVGRTEEQDNAAALLPERTTDRPSVLFVEDNADVRQLLRDYLQADYHVLEAADGAAGLDAAHKHKPDLVLSDVMMPRLDGYELCWHLKADEALRAIPVILLTAKASEADRIYGLKGGADDYLAKPFSKRELLVRITNLILSRQQLRAQFSRELLVKPADVIIQSEEEAFLERVLDVLERHLGDSRFTADALADEVGLSRRQLERKVKALTGETPPELFRRLRLERAARLLRARPGTIAEVAFAVGFKSPSHFSTAFRKHFGTSPSEHIENAP